MNSVLLITERIALTLWVGCLWTVGLLVAPVLFATLDDRALAGTLAGHLFTLTALVGLACGSVLLLASLWRSGRYDWRAWLTTLMLILVAVGQFGLAPRIGALRSAGLVDSHAFAWLHGLASAVFLLTALLGLVLVAAGRTRRPGQSGAGR